MIEILQTGTYCSSNKGDAAMQLVLARELSRLLPAVRCTIGTPFPDIDRDFYGQVACVRSSRRNLLLGTAWLCWLLLVRLVRLRPRSFRLDPEIDAMTRAAAVVDLSGDMLTEDYGVHVGYSHMLPLLQALALGKPLYLLAQSIGPFRLLAPLARFVLRRATMITVREDASHGHVLALGVDPGRLHQTADLAFLLPPADAGRVDAILSGAGCSSGRGLLGVSVSALLINGLHGSLQRAGLDPLSTIAAVLDRVAARFDLDLLLVAHVTGPRDRADDRRVAAMLQRRLGCRAVLLDQDLRPEELKGVISRCEAFFGFRMHANIAALDSAVPVLAVSYSHKTPGIMRMLGMQDHVVPFSTLHDGDLEARLLKLLSERTTIRRNLAERAPGVRDAARKNLQLLAAQLQARFT